MTDSMDSTPVLERMLFCECQLLLAVQPSHPTVVLFWHKMVPAETVVPVGSTEGVGVAGTEVGDGPGGDGFGARVGSEANGVGVGAIAMLGDGLAIIRTRPAIIRRIISSG